MDAFKAMLLDDRDVLLQVVTLASEAELTPRHVDLRPFGGQCDRPAGQYRWNRAEKRLDPLPRTQRRGPEGVSFELAYAFDLLARWDRGEAISSVSLKWLDAAMLSVDLRSYVRGGEPVIAKYIAARGIDLNRKG